MTLFWRKKKFIVNEPDPIYHVVYMGNVVTAIAKGDGCYEKALALIWKTYCTRSRPDIPMKLVITRSGLKAHTKAQGLTEYWAHRITCCMAPSDYARVFVWIYKHEGKRLKPELRCHAALCKKPDMPPIMTLQLSEKVSMALSEYKRDKLNGQNKRLNGTTLPLRKILLRTGDKNFRPPMARSKSAPKLYSIEECSEEEEDQIEDEEAEFEEDEFSVYDDDELNGNQLLSVGNTVDYDCDYYGDSTADEIDEYDHPESPSDISTSSPLDAVVSSSPLPKPPTSPDFTFYPPLKPPDTHVTESNKNSPSLEHPTALQPSPVVLIAPPKRPYASSSPLPPMRRSVMGRPVVSNFSSSAITSEPAANNNNMSSTMSSISAINGVSKSYSYSSVPTTGGRYIKNKDLRFTSSSSLVLSKPLGKQQTFSADNPHVTVTSCPNKIDTDVAHLETLSSPAPSIPPLPVSVLVTDADSKYSTQQPAELRLSMDSEIRHLHNSPDDGSLSQSAGSSSGVSGRSDSSSCGLDFYYSPVSNSKRLHHHQRSIDSNSDSSNYSVQSNLSNYASDSSDITISASNRSSTAVVNKQCQPPCLPPAPEDRIHIFTPPTPLTLNGRSSSPGMNRLPAPSSPMVLVHHGHPRPEADHMDADAVSEESGYHDEKSSVESGSEETLPDDSAPDSEGEVPRRTPDREQQQQNHRGHVISITCL